MVNKRGFMTKKDGAGLAGRPQSAGRKGEYVEPSRQRFGAYGAEVIDGMRIGAADQGVVQEELAATTSSPTRSPRCRWRS